MTDSIHEVSILRAYVVSVESPTNTNIFTHNFIETMGRTGATSNIIPENGAHVPEDKDQRLVVTPYGPGLVVRTRRTATSYSSRHGSAYSKENVVMREIELTGWSSSSMHDENPNSGSPVRPEMLYSPVDYPSVTPVVGSDVLCPFGRGRVEEVRRSDMNEDGPIQGVVVRLSSWRLARRCTVVCYLDITSVQTVRSKRVYEMSIVEKIEHAMELKQKAANKFGQRQYEAALVIYTHAVDAVKYVQHTPDSTNVIRADLLVVMITCCNNAATCCMHLNRLEDALKHSQQAVALLDALENKKGSRIQQELHRQGILDVRLFGEWKVKSLLITARVLTEKDEVNSAMETIQKARKVIAMHTSNSTPADLSQAQLYEQSVRQLNNNDKELLKLLSRCKERRKAILKKEKLRAQAMFASSPIFDRSAEPQSPDLQNENCESKEKQPETVSTQSEKNVENETLQNSALDPIAIPAISAAAAKSDVRDDDVPWYHDPLVLGGLGVVVGTVGTLLLLSQLLVLPKRQS
jgi:tetratricopeptide (TPR) repeat protein